MKILDSSVVILFLNDIEGEEYFFMLSEIGETLLIPESVYKEVLDESTKTKMDSLISKNILKKVEKIEYPQKKLIKNRFPTLGNGELNVLTIGKNLQRQEKKFWCVVDEMPGRNAAEKLNLPLTGSIGLIKILKEKKVLNKCKLEMIIENIKKSPFRIDEEILERLLND